MTTTEAAPTTVIGQRRLRREDPALLTGEAKFTNDLAVPGALSLALVRSPYAHARIVSIDTSAAAEAPGVVAVYTGNDLAEHWAAPMPCAWPVTEDMKNPPHYPLAKEKVCYAGDAVAAVLADTRGSSPGRRRARRTSSTSRSRRSSISRTRCRTVSSSTRTSARTRATRGRLKVEAEEGAIDAAFERAAFTVSERYVQQRLIPMAIETRAVVAVPQPFGGDITIYSATQIPHILKLMMAVTLGIPEHQVRVVAPSVGGGFGSKLNVYAEELLCVALARKHGVPVRWSRDPLREHPGDDPGPRADPAHRPRRRRRTASSRRCGSDCCATWAPTCSS